MVTRLWLASVQEGYRCSSWFATTRDKEQAFKPAFDPSCTQVHDADSLRVTYENPKLAKEAISDIKFSPDGQTLACASHDNMIYLLDADSWRQYAVLSGHSSYVSHVDW